MFKRTAAAGAAIVAVVALTGCVALSEQTGTQHDVIGPLVRLTSTLCTSSPDGPGGLQPAGTATCAPSQSGPEGAEDVLLSYRIPDDVTAPDSLTLTLPDGSTATMSPDADLEAQQEALTPTPDGTHWSGFRSTPVQYGSPTDTQTLTATGDFRLPATADGERYRDGTLPYTVVQGERFNINDTTLPNSAFPYPSQDSDPTYCIESGGFNLNSARRRARVAAAARHVLGSARLPRVSRRARARARAAAPAGNPNAFCQQYEATPDAVDLRNLGVLPGGGATGGRGTSVDVPFNLKFAGKASPDAVFSLSASGIDGASVAPTFTPAADSTTPVAVRVDIPRSVTPGTYDVRLTATKGGQTRSGVTQLTVTRGTAPAPLTETLDELSPTTLSKVLADGLPATVGCNIDCTARVDLLMYKPPADRVGIGAAARYRAVPTVLLGRLRVPLTGGVKKTVTPTVRENAREKLKNLGRFTLLIRTTAYDDYGQETPALVRKVRLKPGCDGRPGCVPRR